MRIPKKVEINLVLADSMPEAQRVVTEAKLNIYYVALVVEPSFLDDVTLYSGETVYISTQASSAMLIAIHGAIQRSLSRGQQVTLRYIWTGNLTNP